MKMNELQKQIEFIKEIDKVKYIQRRSKLFNSDRRENDAEHSWHLAMMALVLHQYTNETIDMLKVLKMVLIHDIVEIDAGDTFLFDKNKEHTNTDEELKAARRIFGILPERQQAEFIYLWEEFEAGETSEAKFARAIDNLEPVLQNDTNSGGTWTEFNVPYETVRKKKMIIKEGSESIWEFVDQLLKENLDKGVLKSEVEM